MGSYESWSSETYWSTDKWNYIYRWDIDNIKVHSLKEPRHFKKKLKGYSNKRDLIIALALPFLITFIVLVIGISTGLMQNVSVSTDIHIWAMFLFNCLFAVLYEVFQKKCWFVD